MRHTIKPHNSVSPPGEAWPAPWTRPCPPLPPTAQCSAEMVPLLATFSTLPYVYGKSIGLLLPSVFPAEETAPSATAQGLRFLATEVATRSLYGTPPGHVFRTLELAVPGCVGPRPLAHFLLCFCCARALQHFPPCLGRIRMLTLV